MKPFACAVIFLQIWLCVSPVSAGARLPPKILLPTYPPGHNEKKLQTLVPKFDHQLFFAEKGKTVKDVTAFGNLKVTLSEKAIILDHSSLVKSVKCSSDQITVCFTGLEAANYARIHWKTEVDTPLIVSAYFPGCGKSDDGERTYWKTVISDLSFRGSCADLCVTEVPFPDLLRGGDLNFGHYKPSLNPSTRKYRDDLKTIIPPPETVDISDDKEALYYFFGPEVLDADADQQSEIDTKDYEPIFDGVPGPISDGWLRNPWSWAKNIAKSVGEGVDNALRASSINGPLEHIYDYLVQFGKHIERFIGDALRHEWALSDSHEWRFNLGGRDTHKTLFDLGPSVFGKGEGVFLSNTGILPGKVQCDNCHAAGSFSISGNVVFGVGGGVKTFQLGVGMDLDSHVAIAASMIGKVRQSLFNLQIFQFNPTAMEIPGVLSIGPQITLSVAGDALFEQQGDLLVGGDLKVNRSKVTLDLVGMTGSSSGFKAAFTPVAKFNGTSSTITMRLGVPLGLELGIDVLNGVWKTGVGVYERLAAEAHATAGKAECTGVDVTMDVLNSVYFSAIGLPFSYMIDERKLWDQGLGCIRSSQGLDHPSPSPASSPVGGSGSGSGSGFGDVEYPMPGAWYDGMQAPMMESMTIKRKPVGSGSTVQQKSFHDLDNSVVLFAGKGDRLFLAPADEPAAAVGASFSSFPDISSSVFITDAYGGFLNYDPDEMNRTGVSNVHSSRLTRMPRDAKLIVLIEVPSPRYGEPGLLIAADRENNIFGLAACSVHGMGTRVYLIDPNKSGSLERLHRNKLKHSIVGGDVRGCQMVYLTSQVGGLHQQGQGLGENWNALHGAYLTRD